MRDFFRDTLADISEQFQTKEIVLSLPGNLEPQPVIPGTQINFNDSEFNTFSELEYGMEVVAGAFEPNGLYVIDIDTNSRLVTFNGTITSIIPFGNVTFYKPVKDKVVGAYDNYYDTYVVSMQQSDLSTYNTLSFNESNNGWTSFWDYDPAFGGTLDNIYYTTKGGSIWKHYDESVINNRGAFYGVPYSTSVTLSFNPMVSISKNFNTVNYEGTNGWQADFFLSDPTGKLLLDLQRNDYKDEASSVKSYEEGAYVEAGVTYRVGFNIKENKYMANLVNNGVQVNGNDNIQFGMPGQVASNISMSGIKGFYATVKLSTDNTTDLGGFKNLFAVSSNFVKS